MHIGNYLELLHKSEQDLAKAFTMIAEAHGAEPDVYQTSKLLASWSEKLVEKIKPFANKYGEEKDKEPDRLMHTLFNKPRKGSLALLRDLHDLWLMAQEAQLSCIILRQAADGLKDEALHQCCDEVEKQSKRQSAWLLTRMKSAAPQTLIVG